MDNKNNELMKKLHFISKASNSFMHQNKQRFTGQQRVLAILNMEDGITQRYLLEVLDLSPSSLAESLKKLENNGSILRKEDEQDKRTKRIYLTDQGRKKASDNLANMNGNIDKDFFAGLNSDEKQQFSESLDKISNGWDEDFKKQYESFVDPMDRFQAMQQMRQTMMEKYGPDLHNMSPETMTKMHADMVKELEKLGIEMPNGMMDMMPGCPPMHHGGPNMMGPGKGFNRPNFW